MRKEIISLYKNRYFDLFVICESSLIGKMSASLHLGYRRKEIELLVLVHNDVCGPMSTQVISGYSYKIWIHILNEV